MKTGIHLLLYLTLLSICTNCFPLNAAPETIPFIIYETRPNDQAASIGSSPSLLLGSTMTYASTPPPTTTSNLPVNEVQNIITQVKRATCNVLEDADVKVWVSIDASGKLLGVGVSGQSGLEVTFHCRGTKDKNKS